MIIKELKKWIRNAETKPLDKNYQKALDDIQKKIDMLEAQYRNYYGEIELQITDIGNIGMSNFSGYVQDAYEYMVQHIDMKLRNPKRTEVTKFLVEAKMTRFNLWEKMHE